MTNCTETPGTSLPHPTILHHQISLKHWICPDFKQKLCIVYHTFHTCVITRMLIVLTEEYGMFAVSHKRCQVALSAPRAAMCFCYLGFSCAALVLCQEENPLWHWLGNSFQQWLRVSSCQRIRTWNKTRLHNPRSKHSILQFATEQNP